MKQTLLRGLLINSLVLGVVANLPDCGDDLVATSYSSIVMIQLGWILLGGVLKFLEA